MSTSVVKEYNTTDIDKLIMTPSLSSIVSKYVYRGVIKNDSEITFIYLLPDHYIHYITYYDGDSGEINIISKWVIPNTKPDIKVIINILKSLSTDINQFILYLDKERMISKFIYDTIVNMLYAIDEDKFSVSLYDVMLESHLSNLHNIIISIYYNTMDLLSTYAIDTNSKLRLLQEENDKLKKQFASTNDKLTAALSQLDPKLE